MSLPNLALAGGSGAFQIPVQTEFSTAEKPDSKPRTMHDDDSRRQDDELVARSQAGDASAFDELIVKYSPRLYGLVYNMTSNHEDTNDMLQDIWAKAYRSIVTFRGKSAFYTWIHTIGVNLTINFLKKRGRRYHLSLDDIDSNIQHDKEFIELTATSSPVREADLNGHLENPLLNGGTTGPALTPTSAEDGVTRQPLPVEKGSKDDYQLAQAMNYLKGQPIVPSTKDFKPQLTARQDKTQ